MTNWLVTLINTIPPFEKKEVVVHSPTIQEALDEAEVSHPSYYSRGARYHSNVFDTLAGELNVS